MTHAESYLRNSEFGRATLVRMSGVRSRAGRLGRTAKFGGALGAIGAAANLPGRACGCN